MKFSLSQLPDEIYFYLYNLDRTPFGDEEEEDQVNMLALYQSDGAILISHDEYIYEIPLERGEIGYDYFYKRMEGFKIS